MHLYSAIVVLICALLRISNSQSYSGYSYPAQRRAGYTYNQPSYYNRPKSYYTSSHSNRNTVQSSSTNTLSNPTTLNSYFQQTLPQRNYKPTTTGYNQQSSKSSVFSGTRGSSYPYTQQLSTINRNSKNSKIQNNGQTFLSLSSAPTVSRGSSNSVSDPINNKQYLTNSYQNNVKMDSSSSNKLLQNDGNDKNRVSKADSENAKFAGADNLENEEDGRTLHLKRRKLRRRFGSLASPCFPFGRDAGNTGTPPPKEQGRFLWDVNVYNVYPQTSVGLSNSNSFGCGGGGLSGFGGLGGVGGLLSDPIAQPYYPPGTGLANFLALFAPGILQNSLAVTARPQLYDGPIQQSQINDNYQNDDAQSDPEVDPNYRPQQPIRRPNRVYYDSAGATPITPGQLVGGFATTVNGIIQQLTGNVQPVYG